MMEPIDGRNTHGVIGVRPTIRHRSDVQSGQLLRKGDNSAPQKAQLDQLTCLVAKVYDTAPPEDRSRLLEHLLRPLGLLSLVAVANGVFAKMCLHRRWPDVRIGIDDVNTVQTADVVALVDYVQQVSVHAVDGFAQMLAVSPVLAGSAAAALLMKVLLARGQPRHTVDNDFDP